MSFTTFQETIVYLESDQFIRPSDFESASGSLSKNPLNRFIHFLFLLDNPHQKFKSVVVSGTSGKGSTTIMIAAMLTAAGYKTGQTISPHLQSVTERLVLNGKQISKENFVDIINTMFPAIEKMRESDFGLPSYFEILLAASFIYFAKEHVDIAVVEVGLEGKYDGTNALSPLGFVLTNISLDHTTILGDTIEKIALEATDRIAYLSKHSFVVSAVMQSEVQELIEKKAKISQSICLFLHDEFDYHMQKNTKSGSFFDFKKNSNSIKKILVSLPGAYQVENASLAIAAVLELSPHGFAVSKEQIIKALSSLKIPGRYETIRYKEQAIILDGAHNSAKMQSFLREVMIQFPKEKKIFIVAFSTGHDAKDMITQIATIADAIFITQFTSTTDLGKNRSISTQEIQSYLHSQYVFETKTIQEAMIRAYELAKQQKGVIVISGSLYLVGQLREYLHLD